MVKPRVTDRVDGTEYRFFLILLLRLGVADLPARPVAKK